MDKDKIEKIYEQLRHIDENKIKEIHDEAIKIGGAWNDSIRDEDSLFYLAEMLRTTIEKRKRYDNNGNHRTAFEMAQLILNAFGYEMKIDKKEAQTFIRSMDRPDIKESIIRKWIENNIKPI